jgi:hypothetical protein
MEVSSISGSHACAQTRYTALPKCKTPKPGPVPLFISNYTTGNLIWNPYGSLTLGMEFLYGWRVNEDGSSGNAPRIMFSAKYNFVRVQSTE